MSVASKKPERTRDAIRHAAAEVFFEKGYSGATLHDLAKKLGIPKGSVSYYVDSKEQLLFEAFTEGLQALVLRLEQIVAYPLAAEDRTRIAIRDAICSSDYEIYKFVVSAGSSDLRNLTTDHFHTYTDLRERYRSLFEQLV